MGAGLGNRCLERGGNPNEGTVRVLNHDSDMAQAGLLALTTAHTDNNYYLLFEIQHVFSSYKIQNNRPWPCVLVQLLLSALVSQLLPSRWGSGVCQWLRAILGLHWRLQGVGCRAHPTSHRICTAFPHYSSTSLLLLGVINHFFQSLTCGKQTGRTRGLHVVTTLKHF